MDSYQLYRLFKERYGLDAVVGKQVDTLAESLFKNNINGNVEAVINDLDVGVISTNNYDPPYALVDISTNKVIIPFKYSLIYPVAKNIVIVEESNKIGMSKSKVKVGVTDFRGNIIIPLEYDSITPTTDIAPKELRKAKSSFPREELLVAEKNGKFGVLTLKGDIVIPFEYTDIRKYDPQNGVFEAKHPELAYGLVDLKNNNYDDFMYEEIDLETGVDVYIGRVYEESVGLVSTDGRISPEFGYIGSFINGIAEAAVYKSNIEEMQCCYDKEFLKENFRDSHQSWGCIDAHGNIVIPFIYDDVFNSSTRVIVRLNEKYGLYDHTGKQLTPIIYDSAHKFNKEAHSTTRYPQPCHLPTQLSQNT